MFTPRKFVADLDFRAGRQPAIGETIIGSCFKLGPGGKGSNQAVAAARAGAPVTFISRLAMSAIHALCDCVTPNETEAALLTGLPVTSVEEARKAGDALLAKGAGTALITLGEAGALFHNRERPVLVPASRAWPVVETAGAGDAFNGGFAAALAEIEARLKRSATFAKGV